MTKWLTPLAVVPMLATGLAVTAPAARAADPDYRNFSEYTVEGGFASLETNCSVANLTGTPYRWQGSGRIPIKAQATATFDFVENTGAKRVVASFATSGSLDSAQTRRWDGSLRGHVNFRGKGLTDAKIGGSCTGYGTIDTTFSTFLRASRPATFTLNYKGLERYASAGVAVEIRTSPTEFGTEVVNDFSFNDRDHFARTVRVRVPKGAYVLFKGFGSVGGFNSWHSSQAPGQPVVYYPVGADMPNGGTNLTYRLTLDPARGQQKSQDRRRTTRVVTFPKNLKCSSRAFTFKPKRPASVRSITFRAGKKVAHLAPVRKVHRVKIKKARATTVRAVFRYKNGKKVTVSKRYHGCR